LILPAKVHKFYFYNANEQFLLLNDLKAEDAKLVEGSLGWKDVCESKAITKVKSSHRHHCYSFKMAIISLANVHNFSMNCNYKTEQYIRSPFELLYTQNNIFVD